MPQQWWAWHEGAIWKRAKRNHNYRGVLHAILTRNYGRLEAIYACVSSMASPTFPRHDAQHPVGNDSDVGKLKAEIRLGQSSRT